MMGTTRHLVSGLLLACGLTLGLAACGGADDGDSGLATAGGTPTAGASASGGTQGSAQEQALRFTKCLRENGIEVADPQDGKLAPMTEGGATKEEMTAATEKCKQYMPNGGERPKEDAQALAKRRELAQCMRQNGVPEFPDPDENGGMAIEQGSGIDPKSEKFKAAQKACEKYQPTMPSNGSTPDGGGQK